MLTFLETHTYVETAEKFGISEMSISRIKKRYKVVKNELIANNKGNIINKMFQNFIKNLKSKPLNKWSSAELRIFHSIIVGKVESKTVNQYRDKIRRFLKNVKP